MDKETYGNCSNCGIELSGKFCHVCGEKKTNPDDYSIKSFLKQSADVFFHFDSAVIRTLKLLFTDPGLVSLEYLEGKRVRYTKPLKLFVLVNIIYFLILNYIGFDTVTNPLADHMNSLVYGGLATRMVNDKLAKSGMELGKYANIFYDSIYVHSKLLLVLMIPMFALVLKLVFIKRKRLYYEHLVFSSYFFTFALLAYTIFLNLFYYITYYFTNYEVNSFGIVLIDDRLAEIVMSAIIFIYLYLSLSKTYKIAGVDLITKTLLTMIGLVAVLTAYNFIIFLVVIYTT